MQINDAVDRQGPPVASEALTGAADHTSRSVQFTGWNPGDTLPRPGRAGCTWDQMVPGTVGRPLETAVENRLSCGTTIVNSTDRVSPKIPTRKFAPKK